jgi:hypothetical protein
VIKPQVWPCVVNTAKPDNRWVGEAIKEASIGGDVGGDVGDVVRERLIAVDSEPRNGKRK